MAKYRRGKKMQPAVMSMIFNTAPTDGGTTGEFTIDLSQSASLLNRRFYRQGINWAVAGIKIITPGTGSIIIKKLPNTWVMSNAWTKGFKAWQKMNNEALDVADTVKPKFLDFKIYADEAHHNAGFGANLLPLGSQLTEATVGEWVPSKFSQPDPAAAAGVAYDREITAVGANYLGGGASGINTVSLIEGYANSRGLPYSEDPATPVDAADADTTTPENWLSAIFNEGTEQVADVLDDMITENNKAPYPFEGDGTHTDTQYPGGANQLNGLQIHDWESVSGTTIGGITRCKGGNFPCGLVRVDWTPVTTSNIIIQVDLIPGNHRGYLCEPMLEM
jgi:hypothetical protein